MVQGVHIPTGEKVAIKILDKLQLMEDPDNLKRVEREIQILKLVKHKNIIRLAAFPNFIEFSENEVMIQTGTIVFDACIFEIS